MSYSWRSAEEFQSLNFPGVKYRVVRMSVGRRLDLTKRLRELMKQAEFLEASTVPQDKVQAAVLNGEVDQLYWGFGLEAIEGLDINGEPATPEIQYDRGPEALSREILTHIKASCTMSEAETKN